MARLKEWMQSLRWVGVAVLALLTLIVVFQNTETVETRLLFMTISMPRAVLLLLTAAIGFALGVAVSFALTRRRRITS